MIIGLLFLSAELQIIPEHTNLPSYRPLTAQIVTVLDVL